MCALYFGDFGGNEIRGLLMFFSDKKEMIPTEKKKKVNIFAAWKTQAVVGKG